MMGTPAVAAFTLLVAKYSQSVLTNIHQLKEKKRFMRCPAGKRTEGYTTWHENYLFDVRRTFCMQGHTDFSFVGVK